MTLEDARKALGWSQLKLDREAGLDKGTTHDLESGRNKNPGWDTVSAVMRAFHAAGLKGLTAEEVFGVRSEVSQ